MYSRRRSSRRYSLSSCKDTEAEPVGRFHYPKLVRNRPRTLDTWRVVTTSQLAADRVAQLLGGHIEQDPRTDCIEILTISSAVGILLSGPNALYIDWQRDDRRACDDVTEGDRQPRICPAALEQRRPSEGTAVGLAQRSGFVSRTIRWLGVFAFVSDDWSFVELIATAQPALSSRKAGRPVRAQLELRRRLHTAQRRGDALYPSRDHALE
ncbi:MAG TPA: hypothetical protein VFL71_05145 [Actinomycetes bacterium]|nr:hypothetical protein [Actinomycetes bacterium]